MINQIRADFYRQLHTRGIALMVIVIAVYAAITCGCQAPGGIMINGQTKLLNQLTENDWSIYDGVRGATLSSSILLYLFIAFFL